MSSYIEFSDDEKRSANQADLYEFLTRRGERLKRSGSEWVWRGGSDKVTIRGNSWFHVYDHEGGGAVRFVQRFFDCDYPEAVQMLLDENCGSFIPAQGEEKERKPFALPKAHTDMRRLYAYLIKQRFIDREIVHYFTHNRLLFEDAEYHNVVFIGCDENGVPRHAHKRGTGYGGGYKGNVEGSLPEYSFHHIGTSNRLYVFEAPVDLLSYLTLYPENWQQHSYVALCCTADHAALYQLRQNPHLREVFLCLDHDKAGIDGCYRLAERIRNISSAYEIHLEQSVNKDWNEDLKARGGINPVTGADHPAMEHIREMCALLPRECLLDQCPRHPLEDLMERYDRLSKINPHDEETITEQTFEMAKAALLFCMTRHRIMGETKDAGWYTDSMLKLYQPHRDYGRYKSHLQDIRLHLESVIKDYSEDRFYTASEMERQISRMLEVGLDCLRLGTFVTLYQEQVQASPVLTHY